MFSSLHAIRGAVVIMTNTFLVIKKKKVFLTSNELTEWESFYQMSFLKK